MKNCIVCGVIIPEGRVKALPHTQTCTEHSTASKFAVHIVSSGDPDKGELSQEVEIIRDPSAARELSTYKKQMGKYSL